MHITEIEVCGDCLIAVANDDYTGMSDQQESATRGGLTALHNEHDQVIPEGVALGFSHRECECCRALPGERYTMNLLDD